MGTLVGHKPIDKTLTDNLFSIFEDTDVIIDFTVPEASILHVEKAADYEIPIVIGTTGFSNEQFEKLMDLKHLRLNSSNYHPLLMDSKGLVSMYNQSLKSYDENEFYTDVHHLHLMKKFFHKNLKTRYTQSLKEHWG